MAWIGTGAMIFAILGCQNLPEPGTSSRMRSSVVSTVAVPEAAPIPSPAPLPLPAPVAVPPPVETNETPTVVLETPAPLPPASPLPNANSVWPKQWVNVWVPLESWGKLNGLAKPTQLTTGLDALFQLQTSNGLVLVKIGSHSANFDGLEYGLGFAPRLIRGLPYIHSLDAQKTFQALVNALLPLPGRSRIVVIDPGHGGKDSGTRSVLGHEFEKNYTLDWALRLEHQLRLRGWTAVLTRTNDTDVPLGERVAVAERVGADFFISLHFNSGGANRDLSGIETYCMTPTGMPSNLTRAYEDDPRECHPNNQYDEQNLQLGTRLHRSLLRATSAVDRGVRHARFMAVLRGQNRPAVLIEGGYLSNPAEARRVATPDYRQLMAEGVAKGLE